LKNVDVRLENAHADPETIDLPPVKEAGLAADKIPLIDIFAGCGGFSEGFLGYRAGVHQYDLSLALDHDTAAHQTHLLRAFFHQFRHAPDEYYKLLRSAPDAEALEALYKQFEDEAEAARRCVVQRELGAGSEADAEIHALIEERLQGRKDWVLIGGPPCQAYSIAGRSRNRAKEGYEAGEDHRHFLYREYLKIIAQHWPAVFVMENVPGVLHSKVDGEPIWGKILEDLADPVSALEMMDYAGEYEGYRLYSLVSPDRGQDLFNKPVISAEEFIVKCEDYGVPQARHRVFILGVRSDLVASGVQPGQLQPAGHSVTCGSVINDLPRLRSGLSLGHSDSGDKWLQTMKTFESESWWRRSEDFTPVLKEARKTLKNLKIPKPGVGKSFVPGKRVGRNLPEHLQEWLSDKNLEGACNHESKAHMPSDIHRYLFAACHTRTNDRHLRLMHFPEELLPKHENVRRTNPAGLANNNFADRFAVQAEDRPARTIVSHIAKDGHYYIHPDPSQGRSFSVREAARVQTFPDNFYFPGARTEQYKQVGNAVPPYLANQIAAIVDDIMSQAGK